MAGISSYWFALVPCAAVVLSERVCSNGYRYDREGVFDMESHLSDDVDKEADMWSMRVSNAGFYDESLECCVWEPAMNYTRSHKTKAWSSFGATLRVNSS